MRWCAMLGLLAAAMSLCGCASTTPLQAREPGIEPRPEWPHITVRLSVASHRSFWPPRPLVADLLVIDEIAIRGDHAWTTLAGAELARHEFEGPAESPMADAVLGTGGLNEHEWDRTPDGSPVADAVFRYRRGAFERDLFRGIVHTITFERGRSIEAQHRFEIDPVESASDEAIRVRWRTDLDLRPTFDRPLYKPREGASADDTDDAQIDHEHAFLLRPGQRAVRTVSIDAERGEALLQVLRYTDPSQAVGVVAYRVDPERLARAADGLAHPVASPGSGWRAMVATGDGPRLIAERLDSEGQAPNFDVIYDALFNELDQWLIGYWGQLGGADPSDDIETARGRRFIVPSIRDADFRLPLEPDRAYILYRDPDDAADAETRAIFVVMQGYAGIEDLRGFKSDFPGYRE